MSLDFDTNGGYSLNFNNLDQSKNYVIKYEKGMII